MFAPLIIALSMYSAIPMPQVDWNKENMQYSLCFFPVVGLLQGLGFAGLCWLSRALSFPSLLLGVLAVIWIKLLTGGIHLDGYTDTVDALSSHASREKMLDIMRDPHVGAFGAMGLTLYLMLSAALFAGISWSAKEIVVYGTGLVLSRALSGVAVVSFPCAKDSGLVRMFADNAAKQRVRRVLCGVVLIVCALMVVFGRGTGALAVVAAALVFLYYRWFTSKKFGGITGDTAGWFVSVCEAAILLAVLLVQRLF